VGYPEQREGVDKVKEGQEMGIYAGWADEKQQLKTEESTTHGVGKTVGHV
jgi:hypothetical protein